MRRRIGTSGLRIGASFETTAWESRVRSVWITTPGNERSRSVDALAFVLERELGDGDIRWLLSASGKVADFSDPAGTLLRDASGQLVDGSDTELGTALAAAILIPTGGRPTALLGLEYELWPDLDLAVLRVRLGIEVPL